MIDSVLFTNYAAFAGNTLALNDLAMPVNEFTMEVDTRFPEREKAERHGIWIAGQYYGKRVMHFSGDIFATDSTAYITKRRAVLKALHPKTHLGYKANGKLDIQFTGQSELWTTDVSLDGYPEIPLQGLSPARSPYQINFKAFDPRFYGVLNTTTYNNVPVGTNNFTITNNGDVETYPIIKIYGQAAPVPTNILFKNTSISTTTTVGVQWTAGLPFPTAGNYMTIDNSTMAVLRNDGTDYYGTIIFEKFWALEPGANNIQIIPGTNAVTKIDIMWRNAYML